ncbi:unnamed protein product [Echinostoma caproni]|uniref:Skp1 domain-containing protein n=1 Tax=Echinostoma caproni TaxID=27848 RepID=A0A183BCW1_9TREM|nr:unnamed protein product [Echinostoma caproni]
MKVTRVLQSIKNESIPRPHSVRVLTIKELANMVVFDCAAKCAGIALDDRLKRGPDLTTPLMEMLCRFRLGLKSPMGKQMLYGCGGGRMET